MPSAFGRGLGYGTVVVRGTDGSSTFFSSLHFPVAFRERVQLQLGRLAPAGTGSAT